ncbi:Response regulator receiver domain protein [Methylobrevis pamukkalensis]|uniref:Response regulator receiver domain protein n=1 Tax=Methylobrevis pamukkalensis TaxID=1439726 RepID=A0A1E3GUE2_9HYPH|nr:Response regulator receiver domain protein [Methylobrevis pamukkalensis]
MQVLIVDDNRTNLMFLHRLADQVDGCTAIPFLDPRAALDHARVAGCDIVLVDYMMPGLDASSSSASCVPMPRPPAFRW